ncbi:MAG: hypothetical protein IKP28_02160 [Clostridia bacterium]|nr:hypothetical protein [Clostridia bacterium]
MASSTVNSRMHRFGKKGLQEKHARIHEASFIMLRHQSYEEFIKELMFPSPESGLTPLDLSDDFEQGLLPYPEHMPKDPWNRYD